MKERQAAVGKGIVQSLGGLLEGVAVLAGEGSSALEEGPQVVQRAVHHGADARVVPRSKLVTPVGLVEEEEQAFEVGRHEPVDDGARRDREPASRTPDLQPRRESRGPCEEDGVNGAELVPLEGAAFAIRQSARPPRGPAPCECHSYCRTCGVLVDDFAPASPADIHESREQDNGAQHPFVSFVRECARVEREQREGE